MRDPEVAWAAGLFEGEGSVSTVKAKNPARPKARLSLGMTDRDVVERFAACVGGKVYGPYDRSPLKDQYHWSLNGYDEVQRVFDLFGPYLGARRSQRFREVLALRPTTPGGHHGRDKTHRVRGHRLDGDNVYRRPGRPGRACRACRSQRKAEAVA